MGLTKIATEIARLDRYVTSDVALRWQLGEERLGEVAKILGIGSKNVDELILARARPDLFRVAYHYGFMPDGSVDGWRILPMLEKPYDNGPHMVWNDRLVEYLRRVLGNVVQRPPVEELAWRMDSTGARLRDVIRRKGILLGPHVVSVIA